MEVIVLWQCIKEWTEVVQLIVKCFMKKSFDAFSFLGHLMQLMCQYTKAVFSYIVWPVHAVYWIREDKKYLVMQQSIFYAKDISSIGLHIPSLLSHPVPLTFLLLGSSLFSRNLGVEHVCCIPVTNFIKKVSFPTPLRSQKWALMSKDCTSLLCGWVYACVGSETIIYLCYALLHEISWNFPLRQ